MPAFADELEQLLTAFHEIKLAILFGSLTNGNPHPDSDIDIAVLTKDRINAEYKIKIIEHLAQLYGRPVDLVDLQTAGEPLLGEILKGQRIIGSDTEHAKLLSRHLIDSADFLPLQQRILKERRDAWMNS